MQAETLHQLIHIFHAHPVNQYIGGGVVADSNHHSGEVAVGNTCDSRCESAHDVAVGNQVGCIHRVGIFEFELAHLMLPVELRENGDLDGTGLRQDFVRIQEESMPRCEV